ncbi:MAG: ATP-grasp domain-containing protein [Acidobacteria bacterium]|nr:ATP-grasp domain-containing protein [Acidobacteriota bacterium]
MSLNVLITAGSRRVPLVRAFQRAVSATGGGRVVVSDVNALSPTVYLADRAYPVPLSTDPAYLDAIDAICRLEQIRLIVPTIDDELTIFAEAAGRFRAAGVEVAVSTPETTRICNDKLATCRVLAAHGIAAASTYLPGELPPALSFPLFIKPRTGRGGVAAYPVRTARELEFFLGYVPDPVVQTYLDGPEFTIDVLCDFDGQPLSIVPRERVVIRAGVVDRGRTVDDAALLHLGLRCAEALSFRGAVNLQCRMVSGQPVVFEVNARFSGGIPLTIEAGADFPRTLVELVRGRHVRPAIGRYRADLWMTNYESSVFVAADRIAFSSGARPIAEVA